MTIVRRFTQISSMALAAQLYAHVQDMAPQVEDLVKSITPVYGERTPNSNPETPVGLLRENMKVDVVRVADRISMRVGIQDADEEISAYGTTLEKVYGFVTYGTRRYFVSPISADALRWWDEDGAVHFDKIGHEVGGMPPQPFLEQHADEIVSLVKDGVAAGIQSLTSLGEA